MLNREEIQRLITEKGLIRGYVDLATQLTPNGFDLTANRIYGFECAGALDFSNAERILPRSEPIPARKNDPADTLGWWHLGPGIYKVVANETVALPKDLIGVAFARSSLLRMGAFTQTGVWDAGFRGSSEFALIVGNPHGIRLKENFRIVQLMFTRITETEFGYNGMYQSQDKAP